MSVSTSPFTNLLVALLHKSILVTSLDPLIPGHEPVFSRYYTSRSFTTLHT